MSKPIDIQYKIVCSSSTVTLCSSFLDLVKLLCSKIEVSNDYPSIV